MIVRYAVENRVLMQINFSNPPGSGKDIAESKGVHCGMGSERS